MKAEEGGVFPSLRSMPEASFLDLRRSESEVTAARAVPGELAAQPRDPADALHSHARIVPGFVPGLQPSSSQNHVLRLHARVPHELMPVLLGAGGASGHALEARFGVHITADDAVHNLRAKALVEVVGPDHAAVRACTDMIDKALAVFAAKRLAIGQIEPLAWAAAPHTARLWKGFDAPPPPPPPPPPSLPPPCADNILRLQARCAPSFIGLLYGFRGERVQALEREFGVKITAGARLKPPSAPPLGGPVRCALQLLEVAGPDHAAVRACAAEVATRYAAYTSSTDARANGDVAAGAPRVLKLAPAPYEARLWQGSFSLAKEEVLRRGGSQAGTDGGGGKDGAHGAGHTGSQAPDGALRLHAQCAPGFAASLLKHGGEGTTALQHAFPGVRVCCSERRQLIEVAGRAEDVVKACAADVGRRHVDATHGRDLQWHAMPIEERLWEGALGALESVGGGAGGGGSAFRAPKEKPLGQVHGGGGGASGAHRRRSRSRSRSRHHEPRHRSRSCSRSGRPEQHHMSEPRRGCSRSRSRLMQHRTSEPHKRSRSRSHSRSRSRGRGRSNHHSTATGGGGSAPPLPTAISQPVAPSPVKQPKQVAPLPSPPPPPPQRQLSQSLTQAQSPRSSAPAPLPPQPQQVPYLPAPATLTPQQQQRSPTPPQPQPSAAPSVADETVDEWFYRAKATTHGPFSIVRLRKFKPVLVEKGKWGGLKVWKAGQTEADAIRIAHLLPDAPA